ncbi:hypothetical protein NDA01_03565 [Trichocoleus desertorum AS-A10]|uniref:hypothetical protein n=1 Tax=Trichocoleus desertorum TaxID=1481672 RepID=UPI0032990EDB
MAALIQQAYSRNVSVIKAFSSASGTSMVQLYAPGSVTPWDRTATIRYYGFITSLRMSVNIKSIPESQIPNIQLTDDQTARMLAVRDMEWKEPRKQIDLFIKNSQISWQRIASLSLLNRLPYYHVNLLQYLTDSSSLEVGNDTRLAARISDAGYGLLNNTDSVTIFGSVQEEATALPTDERDISYTSDFSWELGTNSQIILPANPNRLQASFVNDSETQNVYLSYNGIAQQGKGIALLKAGGTYEINKFNPYKGAISAVATGNCNLVGLEAV